MYLYRVAWRGWDGVVRRGPYSLLESEIAVLEAERERDYPDLDQWYEREDGEVLHDKHGTAAALRAAGVEPVTQGGLCICSE